MQVSRSPAPKALDRSLVQFDALCGAILIAILLMPALNATVSASEFGVSTYRPGLMDLYAGYLAPAGTTLVKTFFMYQDANTKAFTADRHVEGDTHTVTYTSALFAAHVTRLRVLGSNWAFGAIAQSRIASQSLRVGPPGRLPSPETETVGAFGDLILAPIMLNWQWRQLHLMAAMTFYAPTGSYERRRIMNIGTNRWALEPDVGVTWMDEDSGRQASVFIGYTVNRENTASHYRSGDEFHGDFVLAQHLPKGFVLGMAGYALQQTTADSGSAAIFGPYRGRVLALGPLIGKTLAFWKVPINFSLKYDVEFAAQNRSTGNELWLTASTRF
jgi:hypothetical protein